MKKYIGILKIIYEDHNGGHSKLLMKSYDDKDTFNEWFDKYPGSEHIILENNNQLYSMFLDYEDVLTPITEEEKTAVENATKAIEEIKKLIRENDKYSLI